MIGNKTIMVVASGSMSKKNDANAYLNSNNLNNQFQTYDIIVLEKVENASDLNKYDVIAYRNDQGINVIHRIIEIEDGKFKEIRKDLKKIGQWKKQFFTNPSDIPQIKNHVKEIAFCTLWRSQMRFRTAALRSITAVRF